MQTATPTISHTVPALADRHGSRPYVVLSCAVSLDGYLDDATARRLILSNNEDWDRVDGLRAWADAILVGAGTLRADNPRLRVRSAGRRAERARGLRPTAPMRVVVSADGALDPALAFFDGEAADSLVYTDPRAVRGARELLGSSASVVGAGTPLDLRAVLTDLAGRGVERLVVEGGGKVHTQFLAQGLADELQLVTAPFFVGDPRAPRFVGPGRFVNDASHPLRLAETHAIGDLVYARYLTAPNPDDSDPTRATHSTIEAARR